MFSSGSSGDETESMSVDSIEFPLDAAATRLSDLAEFYDADLAGDPATTIAEFLDHALGTAPAIGTLYEAGNICLRVLSVAHGQVESVGLRIATVAVGRREVDTGDERLI
jgi:Mg2+/Co2+ transporter CorB